MAEVVSNLLLWISAALLAVGLTVSQLLLGGWWYPVLAAPSLLCGDRGCFCLDPINNSRCSWRLVYRQHLGVRRLHALAAGHQPRLLRGTR